MTGVISISEFGSLLRQCLPPVTKSVLSIAHSGGPDSSCLLYLLNAWLKTQAIPGFSLISLTVDHQLQSASALVAQRASDYAMSLGIPSYILTIPWSTPPYPRRPSENAAFETIARQARYDALQLEMKKQGSNLLAMAHHADDNVETLLMRLNNRAAPSDGHDSILIANTVRPCRRVGMSNADKLLGMRQWIVRPLLSVPKSRILDTCDHYRIPYTIDETNFQPSITPRNFIRRCLRERIDAQKDFTIQPPANSPFTVCSVNKSVSILESITEKYAPARKSSLAARLYLAAGYASKYHNDIDKEVTSYLSEYTVPSPPSTFIVPSILPCSRAAHHIVRRVLRYVSPAAWGHPSAEAFGSFANLQEISSLLWSANTPTTNKQPFTLGSQVIWRPYNYRNNDGKRITRWIASRQPPILRNNAINPCIANITHVFATSREGSDYLWDNRFLINIRPAMAPSFIRALFALYPDAEIFIVPYSKWFLPRIEIRYISGEKKETIVLGRCDDTLVTPSLLQTKESSSPLNWINFTFIRTLESI